MDVEQNQIGLRETPIHARKDCNMVFENLANALACWSARVPSYS